MKNKKLFIIPGILILVIVSLIILLYPRESSGFDNYENKYDDVAIGDASIVIDKVKDDVVKYTPDNKVNTVIEQVEIDYQYTFKSVDTEFKDALTNIYVRSCTFVDINGAEHTVFINTLSDGTVIAQLE